MCTVTWWRSGADDYGVCFNRDELRTRPASRSVAISLTDEGTRFLCGRDMAAGGTWLLANEHGFIAAVLNHYAAAGLRPPGRRTRGGIPIALAGCRTIDEGASSVGSLTCGDFAPFVLVLWDASGQTSWVWDGETLEPRVNIEPPITTSSYRTAEVCAWRRQRFDALMSSTLRNGRRMRAGELFTAAERLMCYHHDTEHGDGAFNVRMRRPDARTESICEVVVNAREVRYRHQRESPDALEALDEREAAVPKG